MSSFGISGTTRTSSSKSRLCRARWWRVASLARPPASGLEAGQALSSLPLLISGRDEAALQAQASRWAAWLGSHPETDLAAVVGTAAVHRTHFDARASIQVATLAQAQEALLALAEGRPHSAVSTGTARPLGGVTFVFPGQGSQWPAMGRSLLAESAVFAEAIRGSARRRAVAAYGLVRRDIVRGDTGAEFPRSTGSTWCSRRCLPWPSAWRRLWRSLGIQSDIVIDIAKVSRRKRWWRALCRWNGAKITAGAASWWKGLQVAGGWQLRVPVDAVGRVAEA